MNYNNFPEQLKNQKQWVLWKKEMVKDKLTKVPYKNTAQHASSTKSETWTTFKEATEYISKFPKSFDGIGYVFKKDIIGIDLDHCINEDGSITIWAQKIIDLFPSYIEISPSGSGLHIFIYCPVIFKGAKDYVEQGDIERYCNGRYFTVTGNIYKDYKELKGYKPEYFLKWHKSFKKEEPKKEDPQIQQTTLLPEDSKILEVAFKSKHGARIKDLYEGNWQKHFRKEEKKSQSEADLSFIGSLMFFCDNNISTVDRIYRSSGLMRDKWNRQDIRDGIFEKTYCAEPMKWDIPQPKEISEHKIIPLNEILKMEEVEEPFLLHGMIVEGSINALTSDSGKGKSLLMLKMIESIATGEKFLGEFITKKTKTLIVDLEMSKNDIIQRTKSIIGKETEGIDFHFAQTFNIFDDNDFKWLKDTVQANAYKLVVLDTYSMMAPSKSENDNAEANIVNKRLLELINNFGVTILFLHHHRKLQKGEILSQSTSRGATDIIGKTASHLLIDSKDIFIADGDEGLKGIKIIIEQMKRRQATGVSRYAVNVWYNPFEKKSHFEFVGYEEKSESAIEKIISLIMEKMEVGEEYIMSEINSLVGKSSKIYSAMKILVEEQKKIGFRLPQEDEVKNGVKLKHNSKIYYRIEN